ncbi:fructosamine kinase family protein [Boudabousia marimammalium]|uniref:Fructosamine kinase n=1 Tax=Boudabousia marimammalium TaxID=156892 RepID=A0A1Q5PMF1_9ACTO|nr:fructosamine kinase family protein [Boudabousia marimammalium]OKL48655.1 hypothetical protein BM477_05490 [Boudabousia marimammalium]
MSATKDLHRKCDSRRQAIAFEAAGLAWLAEAQHLDGAPVVKVHEYHPGTEMHPACLWEDRLSNTAPTPDTARAFGAALAHTHLAGAPYFGCGPQSLISRTVAETDRKDSIQNSNSSGLEEPWVGDGFMGSTRLPLRHQAPANWEEFYAEDRLIHYLPTARDNHSLGPNEVRVIERLCERLVDQKVTSPLPERFHNEGVQAARIHGDLWSGNVMWAPAGTLIDPAAHGGNPESDLAQLQVFGQPLMNEIYAGYLSVTRLPEHWQERIGLHQLHMLIVHAAIFGGSYGEQTADVARSYI